MQNIFIPFLILAIVLVGCDQNKVEITEPTDEELIKILPEGDEISTNLMKSLKAELKSAITKGGFENAIEVCNLKAIPITEKTEKISNDNVQVKRTTFKFRNPGNAPSETEKLALNYFENLIANNDSIPEYYVQKVTKKNSIQYHYYKPLMIDNVCLGCHGNPENMDTNLLNQISQLYPEDKAMGYKEGDFRGLISVIIPE